MMGNVRTLTATFVARHHTAIASAMHSRLPRWGAHGWRVVGDPSKLRIEVVVPTTVQRPRHPVEPFKVASRWIKPRVSSSGVGLRRWRRADGSTQMATQQSHAVAPGARVRVGRGQLQEFVGIAAVLRLAEGLAILTCGHASAFSFSQEILAGDEPDGAAIATLSANLLELASPIDAAICVLTDAGIALLADSLAAPTWRYKTVKTPAATDNQERAVFWQSHDGDDSAPTAPVLTYSGVTSALFGARGPSTGFIETSHLVVPGDSGSLLSLDAALYGICSGYVGHTAFFTPIATALRSLKRQGKKCSIYTP